MWTSPKLRFLLFKKKSREEAGKTWTFLLPGLSALWMGRVTGQRGSECAVKVNQWQRKRRAPVVQ